MLTDDIRSWRPQLFARRGGGSVADPIVEPHWDGLRVLAFIERDKPVELIDEQGTDVTEANEQIAEALARAARAETLVLDGYLSSQPTRTGIGTSVAGPSMPSMTSSMKTLLVGQPRKARFEEEKAAVVVPHDRDELVAFVAVDLLFVDDQRMLDVPLLERKRILESAIEEEDLVRRTPFVRPPVDVWIGSWRSLGFQSIALKGANSRYTPGSTSEDWRSERIPPR